MLIEDPEDFKSWLTTILEPMCDADPAALAKYVYALVKKDKPIHELRESMLSQLEVFLQKETVSFVTMLFEKLLSKETKTGVMDPNVKVKQEPQEKVATVAVLPVQPIPTDNGQVDNKRDKENEKEKEKEVVVEREKEQDVRDPKVREEEKRMPFVSTVVGIPSSTTTVPEASSYISGPVSSSIIKRETVVERRSSRPRDLIRDRIKSDSEKDDRLDRDRRSRPSRRSSSQRMRSRSPRSRSRSRSWEQRHSRRSRSRNRERDRSRAWRNKSPPPRRDRYDRDRRRSWSKSPVRSRAIISRSRSRSRSLTRSRSPPSKRVGRYRNRSPPTARSHTRSRSPRESRLDKDLLSGPGTPTQDSNHAEPDHRLGTSSQSIQSVVSVKDSVSMYSVKRRCRDFDEKGYCMRGDLCPYDHGADPVILEDVALPAVLSSYQSNNLPSHPPPAPPIPGAVMMSHDPSTHPPVILPIPENNMAVNMNQSLIRPPPIRPNATNTTEYNPDAPHMELRMWAKHNFRGASNMRGMMRGAGMRSCIGLNPAPVGYVPHHQRELVSVPVADNTHSYKSEEFIQNDVDARLSGMHRRNVEYRYPGSRRGGLIGAKAIINHNNPQDNCSLELKKIPQGINNITHLNNHFAKFGKIVNIQVCYEGDSEAALITFSSHAEANAAYKSTEAVLNNRFIKVYWHNSEGKQENVPPRRPSVKERLGAPVTATATSNKVLNTLQPSAVQPNDDPKSDNKVINNMNNINSVNNLNAKKTQEIQAAKETIKKKQEEKRKEALKLTADLRKRKQELLTKQINQQKQLIERLESGLLAPEQRDDLMGTIKTLQESIENIQKDLASVKDKISEAKSTAKVTPQLVKKTREEAIYRVDRTREQSCGVDVRDKMQTQRQILDAELDIFNQQQEGKDTSDLQRRISELKMQARSLGLLGGAVPPPHYAPVRGGAVLGPSRFRTNRRGRGSFPHASVDHRTTKLLVSGFELDDKADVLAHFTQFGQLMDYISDDSTPSLIITYKSRKEAENVIKKGRNFGDRLLSVTWFNAAHNMVTRRGNHNLHHRSVILMDEETNEELLDVDEEDEELEIGEELVLQDEEEEEDEDRSWRR